LRTHSVRSSRLRFVAELGEPRPVEQHDRLVVPGHRDIDRLLEGE